jgi:hypothetical protein
VSCNLGVACIIWNNKIQINCDYIVNMQKYKGFLDAHEVFIIAFFIATILTLYSHYYAKHDMIKSQESELSSQQLIKLYATRFIHYFISFFIWTYAYFAKVVFFNDCIFGIFVFVQIFQWIIFKECGFSIMEKTILESSYVVGSDITFQPFFSLVDKYIPTGRFPLSLSYSPSRFEESPILCRFASGVLHNELQYSIVAGTFIFVTLRLTVWRK